MIINLIWFSLGSIAGFVFCSCLVLAGDYDRAMDKDFERMSSKE